MFSVRENYLYTTSRALRFELRNIRLKLTVLPIKLRSSEKVVYR
jgi:hypothetical protein